MVLKGNVASTGMTHQLLSWSSTHNATHKAQLHHVCDGHAQFNHTCTTQSYMDISISSTRCHDASPQQATLWPPKQLSKNYGFQHDMHETNHLNDADILLAYAPVCISTQPMQNQPKPTTPSYSHPAAFGCQLVHPCNCLTGWNAAAL